VENFYVYWCGRAWGLLRGISMRYDLPKEIRKDMEVYLGEWNEAQIKHDKEG
jgi:hypothetical protein